MKGMTAEDAARSLNPCFSGTYSRRSLLLCQQELQLLS